METADVHALFRAPRAPVHARVDRLGAGPEARPRAAVLDPRRTADPRELPPGCRFAPRCPHVLPACNDGQPPNIRLSPGHSAACLRAREVLVPQ